MYGFYATSVYYGPSKLSPKKKKHTNLSPHIPKNMCFIHLIKSDHHHHHHTTPKKHPTTLMNGGNFQSLTRQSPLIMKWVDRRSSKNNTAYRTGSRINPQSSSTIKALSVLSMSKRTNQSFLTQKHANNPTWCSHKDKRNFCKKKVIVSTFNV